MSSKTFHYSFVVASNHLDILNHVNNVTYLTLFEEARFYLLQQNGFPLKKLLEKKVSPTILEIHIKYLKELRLGDKVDIETKMVSYTNKIGVINQSMTREGEVCCTAEFVMGLFDIEKRKLILPTKEWLQAIGWKE